MNLTLTWCVKFPCDTCHKAKNSGSSKEKGVTYISYRSSSTGSPNYGPRARRDTRSHFFNDENEKNFDLVEYNISRNNLIA